MSTVRFIGDEPREVSILPDGFLRLVNPDETFEVPERFLESYWCQPHFYETPGYDGPENEPEPAPIEPPDAPDLTVIDKPAPRGAEKAGK